MKIWRIWKTGLRRLKIEYHIFLSGNRKKPPDDLRIRVERLVKKLSESSDMSFSQRFRFSTLVTRYYVYKDLWRREVQNREMDLTGRSEPMPKAGAPTTIFASPRRKRSASPYRIQRPRRKRCGNFTMC